MCLVIFSWQETTLLIFMVVPYKKSLFAVVDNGYVVKIDQIVKNK